MKNRIEKLEALVEQRKTDGSHDPENARALLIEEGIYGADGKITPEYGGEMTKPYDVPADVWKVAEACCPGNNWNPITIERIARTILVEREAIEDLLKNPVAVRLNYLRGGIACQGIIEDAIQAERKRCADTIANFPEWVAHSDEVAAETGMLGRQTTRADIVAAVLNPKF